jgi:hypothetical protein
VTSGSIASALGYTPANQTHTHSISQVTGLQSALDGKAATYHYHNIGDIYNLWNYLGDKVDKTAPTYSEYSQTAYVYNWHNRAIIFLNYNGGSGGLVSFQDSLGVGSQIDFIQGTGYEGGVITFSGTVFNRENKLTTLGPGSIVKAIKTFNGWQIYGDLQFAPNGTLISTECAYWEGYDATSTYWSGNFIHRTTYANGSGGTYQSDVFNANGCYAPYGYCLESSVTLSTSTLSWSGCSSSGTYTYSVGYGNLRSDGGGGSYGEYLGGWSAQYGDTISSNGSCYVKYDGMGGFFIDDMSGGNPSYGTYLGQSSGDLYVTFWTGESFQAGNYTEDRYADGNGGVAYTSNRNDSWYGYGTYLGWSNYGYSVYSDGSGGYYT